MTTLRDRIVFARRYVDYHARSFDLPAYLADYLDGTAPDVGLPSALAKRYSANGYMLVHGAESIEACTLAESIAPRNSTVAIRHAPVARRRQRRRRPQDLVAHCWLSVPPAQLAGVQDSEELATWAMRQARFAHVLLSPEGRREWAQDDVTQELWIAYRKAIPNMTGTDPLGFLKGVEANVIMRLDRKARRIHRLRADASKSGLPTDEVLARLPISEEIDAAERIDLWTAIGAVPESRLLLAQVCGYNDREMPGGRGRAKKRMKVRHRLRSILDVPRSPTPPSPATGRSPW